LLLEAGPPDKDPWIHIPLGYAKTYVDPSVNWKFETEPQPQNRRLYLPRGKTLGVPARSTGCSIYEDIIVSGGSYGSRQLLLLSGLGSGQAGDCLEILIEPFDPLGWGALDRILLSGPWDYEPAMTKQDIHVDGA
jgi:GMC oxidoreductase